MSDPGQHAAEARCGGSPTNPILSGVDQEAVGLGDAGAGEWLRIVVVMEMAPVPPMDHALQTQLGDKPLDGAAGDPDTLAPQGAGNPAGTIGAARVRVDLLDQRL